MRFLPAIYMTFLIALVDCLSGCVSTAALKEGKLVYQESGPKQEKKKREFHQLVETTIPIENDGELNAEIFRPIKQSEPKTLIIMVPGSGNVSRKGEVDGDGVHMYPEQIAMNSLWGAALAEQGLFFLSYDKRTCTKSINPLCNNNEQSDIEAIGMPALAQDLDRVVEFMRSRQSDSAVGLRIVLMSTTQGAQTIALSQSAKTADGIILLSPIMIDLESMWIKGLTEAAKNATHNQKTRLMNQRESMISFFKSLKAGEFPETSIIRGASIKFWQTWIDASDQTIDLLKKDNRPTLLLFSDNDSFSSPQVLADIKKRTSRANKISTINIHQTDRNFAEKNAVAKGAVDAVVNFIAKLPAKTAAPL